MIAIIDYDAGNLKSVEKALLALGQESVITRDFATLRKADKVILPGVGAFAQAMENLKKEHKQQIWQQVFDMTNRESANTGMICGGTVKVLFEYLPVKE